MADLLTVEEIADTLKVSKMTVYRLIENRQLPAMRIGRSYRVSNADLTAYLERSRTL